MAPRRAVYLMTGVILATIVACVSLQPSTPTPPQSSTASESADAESQGSESQDLEVDKARPDTKIVTMSIEGEATEVELKLFQHEDLPFTTYYPADGFIPEVTASNRGTNAQFFFSPTGEKDENAYIRFFLPARAMSVETMQDVILGEQGLLITNNWELVDRTTIVSYPWVKEMMLYRQPGNEQMAVGAIYIGQADEGAFYALLHYPIEYGDGFEPRANILLENLQFSESDNPASRVE